MNVKQIRVAAALWGLLALAGCEHEDIDRQHYDNKIFISLASRNDNELLVDEVDSYTRQITAQIAKPESHDISVTFRAAPDLVENYKTIYYDSEVIALPDGICRIDEPQATIPAGSVQSTAVTVNFDQVTTLDRKQKYVMPVTIDSFEGIDGALRMSRTCYFLFRGSSLINVVLDLTDNRAWPVWDNFEQVRNMRNFTMEALINPTKLNKQISTVMGIEDSFLIRLGDSGIDPSQLQVVGSGGAKLTDESLKIPTGEWTHIAVTFRSTSNYMSEVMLYVNGVLKKTGNFYSGYVDFSVPHNNESGTSFKRCFWVGYSFSDERLFEGKMAELRLWNRVLTEDEINAENHFYRVDPESEGLVAYWKLNDGAGMVAKDYSPYGNDLTIESEPTWSQVNLPE